MNTSGKSIPGRGDSLCKGPGVRVNLSCPRNRKRATVARIQRQGSVAGRVGELNGPIPRGCEDDGGV